MILTLTIKGRLFCFLISTLGIFAKIVFKTMESFIQQKYPLTPSQYYGFRKAHSTQNAILGDLNQNAIQTNMNNRLFSWGVFIDLKKAFDSGNQKILLRKRFVVELQC